MVRWTVTGPDRDIAVWTISAQEAAMYHAATHVDDGCWCVRLSEADFLDEAAVRFSRAADLPVSREGSTLRVVGPRMLPRPARGDHPLREVFRPLYEAFTSSAAR